MPRDGSTTPETIDLAPLEALVGFNVHIVDLLMYQRFYERFATPALTPGEFSTLLAIRANPGIRHGALADALLIRRPNLTKLINRLIAAGLARRRRAKGDQRTVALFISAPGERALDAMLAAMPAHEASLIAGLTAREARTLHALLRKLARGLRTAPDSARH